MKKRKGMLGISFSIWSKSNFELSRVGLKSLHVFESNREGGELANVKAIDVEEGATRTLDLFEGPVRRVLHLEYPRSLLSSDGRLFKSFPRYKKYI